MSDSHSITRIKNRVLPLQENRNLLWKLCWIIGAGTVLLFWGIDRLSQSTEHTMSYIDKKHQQEIQAWGVEAEKLLAQQGSVVLEAWLIELQEKEATWAGVINTNIQEVAGGQLQPVFSEGIWIGRSLAWKIHLYMDYNPVMDVPFSDGQHHFLIRLPQRMRPGTYWVHTHLLLKVALPLLILILLSWVLYHHVMTPLRRLEKATRQFSAGNLDVRVGSQMGKRGDELTALAATFDLMAERTGKLIITQRQLLADLSHELRTPLARMDMAIDCVELGIVSEESINRLRNESDTMRHLVEDALTLVWLSTEEPSLNNESVDLNELLQIIVEDACFEFPRHKIEVEFSVAAVLPHSSHRALSQALENIIRNALKYTPSDKTVTISLQEEELYWRINVCDQGAGVPEELLEQIFDPFFRVEKSRSDIQSDKQHKGGYGLGLSLAQRQLKVVGGGIRASNHYDVHRRVMGLQMEIMLPKINVNPQMQAG